MTTINERLRIYRITTDELTMKQIRENFSDWGDKDTLGGLILFYDQAEDKVLIGPGSWDMQVNFCVRVLSADSHKALDKLDLYSKQYQSEAMKVTGKILTRVVTKRMEKSEREKETELYPSSRFISIDGDIFQISKIISVKSCDDGGRHYIEFYITNKRASVRKEFSTRQARDCEFQRIQKTLAAA